MKFNNKIIRKIVFIVANVFPVFAVIFLGWKVFDTLFVYFSETLIFLFLSILKFFYLPISLKSKIGNAIIYSFGMLVFILFTGAVILLFYIHEIEQQSPDLSLQQIVSQIFNGSYFTGLALFTFSHIYSTYETFIKPKKYLNQTVMLVIRPPLLRLWILLMASFLGIAIFKYGNFTPVLILFIVLKTFFDKLIEDKL